MGFKSDGVNLDVYKVQHPVTPKIILDSTNVSTKDSVKMQKEKDTMINEAELVNSIVIYKNKGIQMFGGSKKISRQYCEMINSYKKALGKDVNVYSMIIPTANDFYLPKKFKFRSEKNNIAYQFSHLDSGVIPVNPYTEIEKHTDEYLYFNTDHHWTGRCAYYAYRSFCQTAGLKQYNLSDFKLKYKYGFIGTLYSLTKDSRLKNNPDSVEYYELPVKSKALVYQKDNLRSPVRSPVYQEIAKGSNAYGVFLGGDYPLMYVRTENKSDRKILIIKDSYGNAIAPFFTLHYGEVFIMDYRYFDNDIVNFIKKNKITDFVFLHNIFVTNAHYTVVREGRMIEGLDAPKLNLDTIQ
jgi:hypothetical protein